MWKTVWFNILTFVFYTAASFGLAAIFAPTSESLIIFGGAVAYGWVNVHFVLWLTFYTRERKEAQDGLFLESQDELPL